MHHFLSNEVTIILMHFQMHQNRIIEDDLNLIHLEKNKIIEHISYP